MPTRDDTHGLPPARRWWRRATSAGVAGAVITGVLVLGPGQAEAATTLLVDNGPTAGCSDTPTAAQPFCTISAAALVADTGDTVTVDPGTYAERVDVPKDGVTFVAPRGATVDGGGVLVYGFNVSGSDVTIDGFTVANQTTAGVNVSGGTSVTVRRVTATGSATNGIRITQGTSVTVTAATVSGNARAGILLQMCSGCTVSSSRTFQNQREGVSVQGGTGNTVEGVTTHDNANLDGTGARLAPGINVTSFTPSGGTAQPASDVTVQRNVSYRNDDSGIQVYGGSQRITVRRNLTYDNGDHGIDISQASTAQVVSNTVVHNFAVGINIEATGTGAGSTGTVRDSVAQDNGYGTAGRGDIRVDADSTAGTSIDHDLVFDSAGAQVVQWGTGYYTNLSDLRAASGQEMHGLQGDAKLDPDYLPGAGSPAIDAADSSVAAWTQVDLNGNPPVDDPTVSDTGVGPTAFADLGALERTDVPQPPVNQPPVARLGAWPPWTVAGGWVVLSALRSHDPDGTISDYAFDCGESGVTAVPGWVRGTAICRYPNRGSYTATVTVTDNQGGTGTATARITVLRSIFPSRYGRTGPTGTEHRVDGR